MLFLKTEDLPIEQRRGIESIDRNDVLILVQSPIEPVARCFTQVRQADLWERDVYEREIEIIGQDFIVFQLRGHPWTVIHGNRILPYRVPLKDEDAQALSHLLHTRAICYRVSDTCGVIGYHLYHCGESIEKLYFNSYGEEEMDEDEDEDMEAQGTCQFQSQLRQLEAEDIEDPYGFIWNFFQEQDAYVPALYWQEHSTVGQRVTLQMKGLEREDIERMDYVALK